MFQAGLFPEAPVVQYLVALCASINAEQIVWFLTNPRQIEQPQVAEDHSLCRVVADIRQIEGAGRIFRCVPDGL